MLYYPILLRRRARVAACIPRAGENGVTGLRRTLGGVAVTPASPLLARAHCDGPRDDGRSILLDDGRGSALR